jgi:hypothetical protein
VAERAGEPGLSPVVLARQADVALTTARAYLRRPYLRVAATWDAPMGPGAVRWTELVAAMHAMADRTRFAGLPIAVVEDPGASARQRLWPATAAALAVGDVPNPAALARQTGVGVTTARKFLREPGLRVVAIWLGPVGPDLPRWPQFVAAIETVARRTRFAELPIVLAQR